MYGVSYKNWLFFWFLGSSRGWCVIVFLCILLGSASGILILAWVILGCGACVFWFWFFGLFFFFYFGYYLGF